jgi:hypothetical protein
MSGKSAEQQARTEGFARTHAEPVVSSERFGIGQERVEEKNWHRTGECGGQCADCEFHPEWICGQDCGGCCGEAEGAGTVPELKAEAEAADLTAELFDGFLRRWWP